MTLESRLLAFAQRVALEIKGKAAVGHTHGNYVPTSRTVNGKALSGNIALTASDVGAAATGHSHDSSYYTKAQADASRTAVNVKVSGAVGNGSTNDSAAIQSALNSAAALGLAVYFPTGRYRVTTTVNVPSNSEIVLAPDAVLDISAAAAGTPALQAVGTLGAAKNLTATATEGAKTVTMASTSGIVAGDWVKIWSDRSWGDTGQPQGEIQRVVSVTSTTLTLNDPLADTYATANAARVAEVTFVEGVKITGGSVVGNPATPATLTEGIRLDMCRDVTLSGVTFRWVHHTGLFIADSVGLTVQDCRFDEALGVGLGYGIMAGWATQDLVVVGCHATRTRHLIAVGGGTSRPGISRRITVTGCTTSQCFEAGLDYHPGAEDVAFVGNTVTGSLGDGITAQGGRGTITGNTVTDSARHGILVQNLSVRGYEMVVSGNNVHRSGGRGIAAVVDATAAHRTWSGLSITGNVVTDGATFGIALENSNTTFKVEGVTVVGNIVRRHASHGVYLRGAQDLTVSANHVSESGSTSESVYLFNCSDGAITGNVIRGGARAIRLVTSPGVTVSGNRGVATTGLMGDSGSAPVVVMGNNFAGSSTALSLAGTGNITSTSTASGAYNVS